MRVDPLGFLRNSEEVLNHFLDMLCRFLEYTHDLWRNCCNLIALKKNRNPDVLLEHHLQSNMICKLASWPLPFSPSMSQKLCKVSPNNSVAFCGLRSASPRGCKGVWGGSSRHYGGWHLAGATEHLQSGEVKCATSSSGAGINLGIKQHVHSAFRDTFNHNNIFL